MERLRAYAQSGKHATFMVTNSRRGGFSIGGFICNCHLLWPDESDRESVCVYKFHAEHIGEGSTGLWSHQRAP